MNWVEGVDALLALSFAANAKVLQWKVSKHNARQGKTLKRNNHKLFPGNRGVVGRCFAGWACMK